MRLIRNTGSTVTAADDGRIIENALGDGLFESVEFTISNGQINIPAFKGVLSGRDFTFDAQSLVPALPATSTPATGQIIVRIDLSSETPLSLITVLDPYELTTDDLNESGVVCEMRIATYTASLSGVISVASAANNIVNIAEKVDSGLTSLNNLTNTVAPIARHNVTYASGTDGDGIYMQGGGTTIIGAGRPARKLIDNNINGAQSGTSESVHIAADSTVFLYSNCSTIENRKQASLEKNGNFVVSNGGISASGGITTSGGITASGAIKSGGKTCFPLTYKDIDINLHTATFTQANALYYTEIAVTGWKWIYALTIEFWGGLAGMVQPYIVSASRIGLMTAAPSFPNTNAMVTVRIVGERISGD